MTRTTSDDSGKAGKQKIFLILVCKLLSGLSPAAALLVASLSGWGSALRWPKSCSGLTPA